MLTKTLFALAASAAHGALVIGLAAMTAQEVRDEPEEHRLEEQRKLGEVVTDLFEQTRRRDHHHISRVVLIG